MLTNDDASPSMPCLHIGATQLTFPPDHVAADANGACQLNCICCPGSSVKSKSCTIKPIISEKRPRACATKASVGEEQTACSLQAGLHLPL